MQTLEEINPDHINDTHGIYQLQIAAKRYGRKLIPTDEDLSVALEGPAHEDYYDVGEEVIQMWYEDAELVALIANWSSTWFIMSKEDYENLDLSSLELNSEM